MMIEQVSDDPEIQERYRAMRLAGESHNVAEVLAFRRFPKLGGTDKAFNRGRVNGNQFEHCPQLGNYFKSIADSQGVSVNGKHYMYGLGRYPGDPRAWVSDTHDAVAVARELNCNLDGIVNFRGHEVEPASAVPLAADLWQRDTEEYLSEHPGTLVEDAREKVLAIRTGKERPYDHYPDPATPSPDDVE